MLRLDIIACGTTHLKTTKGYTCLIRGISETGIIIASPAHEELDCPIEKVEEHWFDESWWTRRAYQAPGTIEDCTRAVHFFHDVNQRYYQSFLHLLQNRSTLEHDNCLWRIAKDGRLNTVHMLKCAQKILILEEAGKGVTSNNGQLAFL